LLCRPNQTKFNEEEAQEEENFLKKSSLFYTSLPSGLLGIAVHFYCFNNKHREKEEEEQVIFQAASQERKA